MFSALPGNELIQPFHPDEGKITGGAHDFPRDIVERQDLRYPTGLHYLIGLLIIPFKLFETLSPTVTLIAEGMYVFVIGRFINILFGVAAVYLTFKLGKNLHSLRAGLIAAGILCLSMYHVRNSSFVTTDISTSFWLVVVLLNTYRLFEDASRKNYILVGVTVGMLVGFKYTGAFAAISVFYLYLYLIWRAAPDDRKRYLGYSILSGGIAVLIFGLTTPAIMVNPQGFFDSISFETTRVASRQLPWWDITIWSGVYTKLSFASNPLLSLLLTLGAGYAVIKPHPTKNIPQLLLLLLFFGYFTNNILPRYFIFVLPVMAIMAGKLVDDLYNKIPKSNMVTLNAVLILGILYSLGYIYSGTQVNAKDPRISAAHFISENIPPGSSIGDGSVGNIMRPSTGLPGIDENIYDLTFPLRNPEYVILSSIWFNNIERALKSEFITSDYILAPQSPQKWYRDEIPTPEVFGFYDDLLNQAGNQYHYQLIATFKRDNQPHYEFPYPEIRIYQRVDPPIP